MENVELLHGIYLYKEWLILLIISLIAQIYRDKPHFNVFTAPRARSVCRKSLRYVGWKERKAVATDLITIYSSATLEGVEEALDAFAAKWDEQFPTISPSWRNNWERLIVIFDFPPEIRKLIAKRLDFDYTMWSENKISVSQPLSLFLLLA